MLEKLRERLRLALQDCELPRLSPGLVARVRLEVGPDPIEFTFGACGPEPDIIAAAEASAWEKVLACPAPPLFHAFTAIERLNPDFRVTGDGFTIARARPALERIFERITAGSAAIGAPVRRDLSQIIGRYFPITAGGSRYEIYFETSGHGTPLVFLHTAGADSRQFHAQLSNCELAGKYRMFAFDLPLHGRSLPPDDWDGAPYLLTCAQYLGWVAAFLDQVVRERAIVCGGSMGAAIALVLAKERPELVLGCIAVEPPYRARRRRDEFQNHVAVHGALHTAAFVHGLTSPRSPEHLRRRADWIYSQGAPGIYSGDLAFYSEEFDGALVAPEIDASRVPVALLSGEYDYSASPEQGRMMAELIPGSSFEEMPGLGHFPMCENPDVFRPYLMRALAHIHSKGGIL